MVERLKKEVVEAWKMAIAGCHNAVFISGRFRGVNIGGGGGMGRPFAIYLLQIWNDEELLEEHS
jgi:hypothetical protein